MAELRRVCVFCGSASGARPEFAEAARQLGRELLARRLGLVYGGGHVGLMGIIARTVHEGGGEVIGVIPAALMQKELGYTELPHLRVVSSMHERKALMADLSDAFVALPGGVGTLEELFEVVTWGVLGIHAKPCGVLNVAGYFDHLLAFLDHAVADGFLKTRHHALILTADSSVALLDRCAAFQPPALDRWLRPSQT